VLWCGRDWASMVEENGAFRHVSTPILKSVFERGGYMRENE